MAADLLLNTLRGGDAVPFDTGVGSARGLVAVLAGSYNSLDFR
jgi:hypothetical protein